MRNWEPDSLLLNVGGLALLSSSTSKFMGHVVGRHSCSHVTTCYPLKDQGLGAPLGIGKEQQQGKGTETQLENRRNAQFMHLA